MQDAGQIGQALPPATAHLLPVMERGGTGRYLALCLCDLDTVYLGVLLQRLQALLGVFEVPFGLAQTTEDGKRIPLAQAMAQVKSVRDTQAAKPRVGQL